MASEYRPPLQDSEALLGILDKYVCGEACWGITQLGIPGVRRGEWHARFGNSTMPVVHG
jgi:hypothetical protein